MNRCIFMAIAVLIAILAIPAAQAKQVKGTGVLASFRGGDIKLVADEIDLITSGTVCALWLEVRTDFKTWRLNTVARPDTEVGGTSNRETVFLSPFRDDFGEQLSEVPLPVIEAEIIVLYDLRRISDPNDDRPNFGSNAREEYITEDGFHVVVSDATLSWDFGRKDGCFARADVRGRQR